MSTLLFRCVYIFTLGVSAFWVRAFLSISACLARASHRPYLRRYAFDIINTFRHDVFRTKVYRWPDSPQNLRVRYWMYDGKSEKFPAGTVEIREGWARAEHTTVWALFTRFTYTFSQAHKYTNTARHNWSVVCVLSVYYVFVCGDCKNISCGDVLATYFRCFIRKRVIWGNCGWGWFGVSGCMEWDNWLHTWTYQ